MHTGCSIFKRDGGKLCMLLIEVIKWCMQNIIGTSYLFKKYLIWLMSSQVKLCIRHKRWLLIQVCAFFFLHSFSHFFADDPGLFFFVFFLFHISLQTYLYMTETCGVTVCWLIDRWEMQPSCSKQKLVHVANELTSGWQAYRWCQLGSLQLP